MLNDPEPRSTRRTPNNNKAPRQQVMLHIPAVRPYATYSLIIANVVVFIAAAAFPDIVRASSNYIRDVLLFGEYHRLATALFLHTNLAHLLVNIFTLYTFGAPQERIFGHLRFTLIYLLGGLAGSVLATLLGGDLRVMGASPAVFAVLGAELVYLYQHRKLLGDRGRRMRDRTLLFSVITLIMGVMFSVPESQELLLPQWSHLGGLVGGVVLGWFIAPFFNLLKHPDVPNAIRAEDINPLNRRYNVLIFYVSVLLGLLILATTIAR